MEAPTPGPASKPEIALLYSLARTGGTLLARCLGAIPGHALLSEINPRMGYIDPVDGGWSRFSSASNGYNAFC